MSKKLLFRLAVLVAAMMCALGAAAAEAYACYTSTNTTLTFYYDNYRSSRSGTTYDLNTGTTHPGWETDGTNANVTRVVFDTSFANYRPTTTYSWFSGMANLQTILGISNLNTSEVTDMGNMFRGCTGLTSLDLSNFNTSKVYVMVYMFYGCTNLRTIYASEDWSMEAVMNSTQMFNYATSLVGGKGTTYDASHIDKAYAHIDGGPSNPGYFTAVGTEAYACYTPENTTLTFYYDTDRSTRPGTTYDLNTGEGNPGWYTDNTEINVTQVVFHPFFAGARPTTTFRWFHNMQNLESFTGLSYLKTNEVTNMGYMFNQCSRLAGLDVSQFNTSKVIKMWGLFRGCTGLTSLDLSSFNTSNVTDMNFMFGGCSGLTSLDLSSFNTFKVVYMDDMFSGCGNLRTIYVSSGWSTDVASSSTNMFLDCNSLVGGQGSVYDASHTDATYAHIDGGASNPGYFTAAGTEAYACYTWDYKVLTFYYDDMRAYRMGRTYDLNTEENYPGWYTDGTNANVTRVAFDTSFADYRPTTTYSWFKGMENLQTILGISNLNTSEVTDMGNMFRDCTGLTSLDLSSFNTSKVTNMTEMFRYSSSLLTIIVGSGWSTASVTSSTRMFGNCTSLVGGQGTTYDANHTDAAYAHIDGGASNPGYFTRDPNEPKTYACYTSENTTLTFYYDTERDSRPGTTYDLNTGEHDPGWKTDDTVDSVTQVVFDPSFANARPTTTYEWFFGMQNLQAIEGMEYLNTSAVTNMWRMFGWCSELTSLDLSHFNTSKVTNMAYMFYRCTGLTSLDLSSFNTTNVTDMSAMFYYCSNLTTIYVGDDWSMEAVTNSTQMFNYATSLVGGQGTTYDASHIDKAYAHIDGGPSNPGYFTAAGTEAYACYTSENTTLTFYYDTERDSRPGTTYDLNTGMNTPAWRSVGSHVTQVVFDPSFANAHLTTTYSWFYGMQNLQTIEGMEYLNTSEVTVIAYMFGWCTSLTSLDVSHFNTSKVTNMGYMFYYCESLTSLDLSSFNTSKVTNTGFMFYGCSNLRTIYASEGWSTEAMTNSTQMFNYATSLVGGKGTTYDVNHIDKAYAHIDGGTSNPGYFSEKGGAFLRGDVNGDGSVNISDVTALIDLLLGDGTINNPAADCNNDTNVTISDVTALIDYLLGGTWN